MFIFYLWDNKKA